MIINHHTRKSSRHHLQIFQQKLQQKRLCYEHISYEVAHFLGYNKQLNLSLYLIETLFEMTGRC